MRVDGEVVSPLEMSLKKGLERDCFTEVREFDFQRDFLDKLDETKQYFFIVSFNENNRIVCKRKGKIAKHIATMSKVDNSFEFDFNSQIDGVFHNDAQSFDSVQCLVHHVNRMNPLDAQGILAVRKYHVEEANEYRYEMYKIMIPRYIKYSKIRGNQSSLVFRYLQIRRNKQLKLCFIRLFDSFDANGIEDTLRTIAYELHKKYSLRFILKQFVVISPEPYQIHSSLSFLVSRE